MNETHIVVKCCRCRRVRLGDQWIAENELPEGSWLYSHHYCPECMERVHAELAAAAVAVAC